MFTTIRKRSPTDERDISVAPIHREMRAWLAQAPQRVREDTRVQRLVAEMHHYERCLIRAQQDHAAKRLIPSLVAWLHWRGPYVVLVMAVMGALATLHRGLLLVTLVLSTVGTLIVLGRGCWCYALRSRRQRALVARYQQVLVRYHSDLIQLLNTLQRE